MHSCLLVIVCLTDLGVHLVPVEIYCCLVVRYAPRSITQH